MDSDNMVNRRTTDTIEHSCIELLSHQGVALKTKSHPYHYPIGSPTDGQSHAYPVGTLTVVQYNHGNWIEWKQTDVSFELDNTDPEWDLVDAVTRKRTCSTSSNTDAAQQQPTIRLAMGKLKSYKIKHHGRQISLKCRDGQHFSFLFQCGNADGLIAVMRAVLITKRVGNAKNIYTVIGEKERQPNKSFNELNLFPNHGEKYVWTFVRNLHDRPYETTLQTFSKLTDVLLYRPPEHRPDDEVLELLTKSLHSDSNDTVLEADYTIVEGFPKIVLPSTSDFVRGSPLNRNQWSCLLDEEGRVIDPDSIKALIFKGGIEPDLRAEVWKYLLGYYNWNFTRTECEHIRQEQIKEYRRMKLQWQSMSSGQEERFSAYRERKSLIEKDVNRTDRTLEFFAGDDNENLSTLHNILMTYTMYNFDLGYVQGMSDLLAPILFLINDEVDAFWCFVGFMDRVYTNFDLDQAGMKQQLAHVYSLLRIIVPDFARYLEKNESTNMFFCFRWLLVLFKREFTYSETMTLWEVLWTDLPCNNFHLLICVAILCMEKEELTQPGNGFTEILKYVNELSQKMNLDEILSMAEGIFYKLKEVEDKLPLNIKRLIGLAPPAQENDSENSDDDSLTSGSQKEIMNNNRGTTNESEEKDGDQRTTVEPIESDLDRLVIGPHTDDIGFEGIEKAINLNYY